MFVPLNEINREIKTDPVKPRKKLRIEPERIDAFVRLLEGLHREVPGVRLVIDHVVEHAEQLGLVTADQFVKSGRVARPGHAPRSTRSVISWLSGLTVSVGSMPLTLRSHLIVRKTMRQAWVSWFSSVQTYHKLPHFHVKSMKGPRGQLTTWSEPSRKSIASHRQSPNPDAHARIAFLADSRPLC